MNANKFWNNIRRQAPGEPAAAPTEPAAPTAPPADNTGPDLSFIPADFHVDGKPDLAKFAAHYQEVATAHSQRPTPPSDGVYDFSIPADFKIEGVELPEGFSLGIPTDDPVLKPVFDEAGEVLKKYGLPGEAAGDFAKVVAKIDALRFNAASEAMKQDMAVLGTPAQQEARVTAVQRKLETMLPADQVEAVKGLTTSAKALMALEKILSPASLSAPVPQPPGADLEKMTPYDRLKIANAQGRR